LFGDDSFIRSFVLACCDRLDKVGTDRPQQNLVLHEKTDAFALPRVAFRSQRSILLVFFGVSAVAPFWFVLLASHRVANKQTKRQTNKGRRVPSLVVSVRSTIAVPCRTTLQGHPRIRPPTVDNLLPSHDCDEAHLLPEGILRSFRPSMSRRTR